MLSHQLQALPPVESFWSELPGLFAWLESGVAPTEPAAYRMAAGETLLRQPTRRLPVAAAAQSYLEIIRFAGANHLCVDLRYQGSVRRIEPYSLRRTHEGNILLHAVRASDGQHRSYRINRIQGVQTTGQRFIPHYAVELSPRGPAAILPTTTGTASRRRR